YRELGDPDSIASFNSFHPSLATAAAFLIVRRKLSSSRAKLSSAGSTCLRSARPRSVNKTYAAHPPITAPAIVAAIARALLVTRASMDSRESLQVVCHGRRGLVP